MADETIKIKISSDIEDYYVECKSTDKVEKIIDIVKARWGKDGFITFRHESELLESDKTLASYNVKEGSIIHVKFYVAGMVEP